MNVCVRTAVGANSASAGMPGARRADCQCMPVAVPCVHDLLVYKMSHQNASCISESGLGCCQWGNVVIPACAAASSCSNNSIALLVSTCMDVATH